ncbi:unnamed protein product [Penicillium glandicola]
MSPVFGRTICTGFTRISEETSEIVFLLVENYQIDYFKWAFGNTWEFLKQHCLNSLTFVLELEDAFDGRLKCHPQWIFESFHYLLPMLVALGEEILTISIIRKNKCCVVKMYRVPRPGLAFKFGRVCSHITEYFSPVGLLRLYVFDATSSSQDALVSVY